MKIYRFYNGQDGIYDTIKLIEKDAENIVPQKMEVSGKLFKQRNWIVDSVDYHLCIFLYDKKYEKEFIKLSKKYDVDYLFIHDWY